MSNKRRRRETKPSKKLKRRIATASIALIALRIVVDLLSSLLDLVGKVIELIKR